MSGSYKVAWLCEALLVSRSGYYDWKERRAKPGPRDIFDYIEAFYNRIRLHSSLAYKSPINFESKLN